MESHHIKTPKEKGGDGFSEDLPAKYIKNECVDNGLEDINSNKCTIKREMDDTETLADPLFVPVGTEPDCEVESEGTVMEENFEGTENTVDVITGKNIVKENIDVSQSVMDPLFLPIKAEPDFPRVPEESVVEENFEGSEMTKVSMNKANAMIKKESAGSKGTWLDETDHEPKSCILLNPSKRDGSEESAELDSKKDSMNWANMLIKEESIEFEENWQAKIKPEPTLPLSMNAENDGSVGSGEQDVNVKDMVSSKCTKKENIDISDLLMEPILVPIKAEPCCGRTSQESVVEENIETRVNPKNLDTSECSLRADTDNAEVMILHFFSPFKTEANIDDILEENILQENSRASEVAELSLIGANCLVEEEVIDIEQQEPMSPSSLNRPSDGADDEDEYDDSTTHLTRLPEGQCPVAESCIPEITSELMGSTKKNNSGETIRTNGELIMDFSNACGESVVERCWDNVASSSFSKGRLRGKVGAGRVDLGEIGRRKWSGAGERHYKTGVNQKTSKTELRGSVSKKTSKQSRKPERTKKSFCCDTCGKCFNGLFSLENHIRTHTGARPFQCFLCNKTFTTKGNLVEHTRVHSEERPHKCSVCEKSFKYKSARVTHERVHTREKPFECSVCKKSFSQSNNLSIHMRTHTGKKPYTCTECRMAFSQKVHLTTHMRVHTREKPYSCSECEKAFSQDCDLTCHMRIHTGERPFTCKDCGRCFTQSSTLHFHRRCKHVVASLASKGSA